MADALKELTWVVKAKNDARLADFAAKEMAKHCDKRIALVLKSLRKIQKISNGSGNARTLTDKIYWECQDAIKALAFTSPHSNPTETKGE